MRGDFYLLLFLILDWGKGKKRLKSGIKVYSAFWWHYINLLLRDFTKNFIGQLFLQKECSHILIYVILNTQFKNFIKIVTKHVNLIFASYIKTHRMSKWGKSRRRNRKSGKHFYFWIYIFWIQKWKKKNYNYREKRAVEKK